MLQITVLTATNSTNRQSKFVESQGLNYSCLLTFSYKEVNATPVAGAFLSGTAKQKPHKQTADSYVVLIEIALR